MVASKVISSVRLSLGDVKAQRWSDDRLVNLVDEAQKDICLHTHMYRNYAYIPLIVSQYKYDLPEDFLILHRVQNGHVKIPLVTRNVLDEKSLSWRDAISDNVVSVLKDSLPMGQLEVYPKPSDNLGYVQTYVGEVEDPVTAFILEDALGVWSDTLVGGTRVHMTSLTGSYHSIEYVITSIDGIADLEPTVWGLLTDVYSIDGIEGVSYPEPAEGVTSDISVEEDGDDSIFGTIVDIDPQYAELDTGWGGITSIVTDGSILKVMYTAVPPEVTNVDSPLILASIWATALKYYVAGYALLDDNDAGNQQRGSTYLQRYARELGKASQLSTSEQSDVPEASIASYQTPYRRY